MKKRASASFHLNETGSKTNWGVFICVFFIHMCVGLLLLLLLLESLNFQFLIIFFQTYSPDSITLPVQWNSDGFFFQTNLYYILCFTFKKNILAWSYNVLGLFQNLQTVIFHFDAIMVNK